MNLVFDTSNIPDALIEAADQEAEGRLTFYRRRLEYQASNMEALRFSSNNRQRLYQRLDATKWTVSQKIKSQGYVGRMNKTR